MKATPFILGQYRPLDSFLHRLDARAKIIPMIVILIVGLLNDSPLFSLVIILALAAALLMSRIAWPLLARNLYPILVLAAITAAFHLVFSGAGSPKLVSILGVDITEQGAYLAALYSLRLILFVSLAFLITLTTSPSDLADTFAVAIRPLERIKVPVYDLALIVFMAIRFIPILYDEFETIRHAQTLRGMRFDGPITVRIRKTSALLIPVFLAAMQRADQLADAIQVRGYGKSPRRTLYSTAQFGLVEVAFTLFSITGVILLHTYTRQP